MSIYGYDYMDGWENRNRRKSKRGRRRRRSKELLCIQRKDLCIVYACFSVCAECKRKLEKFRVWVWLEIRQRTKSDFSSFTNIFLSFFLSIFSYTRTSSSTPSSGSFTISNIFRYWGVCVSTFSICTYMSLHVSSFHSLTLSLVFPAK